MALTLKAANGKFVQKGGIGLAATADDGTVKSCQITVEPQPNSLVALKQSDFYWSAQENGTLECNRLNVGPWELFQKIKGEREGSFGFKSEQFGTYVSARLDLLGSPLDCRVHELHDWESFDLVGAAGDVRPIHVDGLNFKDDLGNAWVWAMMDGFRDLDRLLQNEDINPQLAETVELGANGKRCLGMADSFMHLWPQEHGAAYYDGLSMLFDLYASHGLYGQFCCFADTRIIMPDRGEQIEHFVEVRRRLAGRANAFGQLVNENDANQNGVDIASFPRPNDGICWSSGSNGGGSDPPRPFWDYSDLGSERHGDCALSTTTVWFAIHGYQGENGAPNWPGTQRATVVSEPPGFDEVTSGNRISDPHIAYLNGLGTQWGNGGTFHSSDGVQSALLRPNTKACALEFVRGMRLVE